MFLNIIISKSPTVWCSVAGLIQLAGMAGLAARNPHLSIFSQKFYHVRTSSDCSEFESCQTLTSGKEEITKLNLDYLFFLRCLSLLTLRKRNPKDVQDLSKY